MLASSRAGGLGAGDKHVPKKAEHQQQEVKASLPAVALQRPLPTKLNMQLAGRKKPGAQIHSHGAAKKGELGAEKQYTDNLPCHPHGGALSTQAVQALSRSPPGVKA